jgi:hypothetical protein
MSTDLNDAGVESVEVIKDQLLYCMVQMPLGGVFVFQRKRRILITLFKADFRNYSQILGSN